jgi:hypothetical protein
MSFTCRQCYEEWSAYGVEVPMCLCVDGVWQQVLQTYVPYLSGMQLFRADFTRRLNSKAQLAETPVPADAGCPAAVCRDDLSPRVPSNETASGASESSSRTVSTASTDSDSDGEECCSAPSRAQNLTPGRSPLQRATSAARGSVLRGQLNDPAKGTLSFQFAENEPPHCRLPLTDRIEELAESFPGLHTLRTSDLHPASWYAVAWYPLYRLPYIADPAASRDLQASFLTFHSLAAPPPSAPMAGPLTTAGSGAPIPPQLTPPAAAGLAYRGEVLRQALLFKAMKSVLPSVLPKSSPIEACESASEPHEDGVSNLVGPSPTLSSMPMAVATLQPFGFVPYKAVGQTWVDEFALHRLHLPMIAAARAWTERRGINLPDLEFFCRHSEVRQEWLPRP